MLSPIVIAYLLILLGLFLLVVEMFVPSGGIIFLLGVCALVGGVMMTFVYADNQYVGWATLIGVVIVVPVVGGVLLHYWPKTRMGQRLFLTGPEEDDTIASMPVNTELEQLRGRLGRALSALRPAGVVNFDGRRVDCITEGMMVEPDQWVRCIDVKAGRVIVRPVDETPPGGLENLSLD